MALSNSLFVMFLATLVACTSGAVHYNTEKEICCNGSVFSWEDGLNSCCGATVYNPKQMACCNQQVMPLPVEGSINYGCCSTEDRSTEVAYDIETYQCCDGKLIEKPDKNSWYGCCGDQLYNYTLHICCGENLVEREDNMACCVDAVYDVTTQTCCQNWGEIPLNYEIHDKVGNRSYCCGTKLYDYNAEVCCDGVVKPLPEEFTEGSWAGCCDGTPYDGSKQLCCSDWKMKDSNWTQTNAQLFDIVDSRTSCCKMEPYDYNTEICCEGGVRAKPEGYTGWVACCGDEAMTDYQTQVCANGRLLERSNQYQYPCGDDLYDIQHQNCCYNEVYDLNSTYSCCYQAEGKYDRENELCCGSEIVPMTEEDLNNGNNACCAPIFYHSLYSTAMTV